MRIDLNKAYKYYIDNINKSENKNILTKEDFSIYFSNWLQNLAMIEQMNPGIEKIPEMNKNGTKSRIISLQQILKKCM